MKSCNIYQRIKNRMEIPIKKLRLSEVPEKLWIHLIVDFIMKLPLVAGKNTILVVCNWLSKMTHFVATTEEVLVEGVMRCLDLEFLFYFILFFWMYNNFLFYFDSLFFIDNEEACDIEVTWLITWCNVRSLEDGRRVWKMTSGYIE